MMGGSIKRSSADSKVLVRRTEEVIVLADGKVPLPTDHITHETLTPKASATHPIRLINLGGGNNSTTAGTRTQITSGTMENNGHFLFKNDAMGITSGTAPVVGDHIRIFWEEEVANNDAAVEVTISPDTFPGTYRIVGDTFMRSAKTGKDEAFQFVIEKAKVASNVTLTLEAEGDPSTFEMSLTVLRDESGEMMKLIRYGGSSTSSTASGDDIGSMTGSGS